VAGEMNEASKSIRAAIARIERTFSERARHPITIDGLITEWNDFAERVGRGYELGIYDYMNELSRRDMLQDAARTPELRSLIEQRAASADEAFRRNTRTVSTSIRPPTAPDRWWWYARPIVVKGELAEDFARERETEA
jgi:hypothetical protein